MENIVGVLGGWTEALVKADGKSGQGPAASCALPPPQDLEEPLACRWARAGGHAAREQASWAASSAAPSSWAHASPQPAS